MKRQLLVFCMAIVAIPVSALDRTEASPKNERAERVARLRSDLSAAIENAELNEQQRRKLGNAMTRLGDAEKSLRQGKLLNPFKMIKMRGAINDIEKICRSGVFRQQDRRQIEQDIYSLKNTKKADEEITTSGP